MNLALIIMTIILAMALIACAFIIVLKQKKLNHSVEVAKQKTESIDSYFITLGKITDDKSKLKERVIELENGIQNSYGVKIRQEVTKVIADFSKIELVFMMAGLDLLIKKSDNREDIKYYIKLVEKIQGLVDKMENDEEKAFKK